MDEVAIAEDAREKECIERAKRGDREAFDRLVSSHLARVWRVVSRIVRHREDAEDVVQEVFLTAYRSLEGFRGECKLSTWLHRLAVTRALNHLDRAAEKVRRSSVELDPERDGGPDRSPLSALEAKERLRRLAECFERLPAGWRAVIALRDGESLAYEEIADRLQIALGTVRSRLARARISLRDCVQAEAT